MESTSTIIEQNDLPPMFFEVEASTSDHIKSQMTSAQVRQVLAQAVIERLQHWCMQLFWMTVLCVMNCCGDDAPISPNSNTTQKKSSKSSHESSMRRKSISEIEQNLLRNLTSPYISSPLRPVHRPSSKKRILSRPPSPQLFDIAEEE